jgi:hypothetical protein
LVTADAPEPVPGPVTSAARGGPSSPTSPQFDPGTLHYPTSLTTEKDWEDLYIFHDTIDRYWWSRFNRFVHQLTTPPPGTQWGIVPPPEFDLDLDAVEEVGLRTVKQAGISPPDAARIQAVADKVGGRVTVVGSRAEGTASPWSDWDYIVDANAKGRSYARWQLPRGVSGGEVNGLGQETGIDIFGEALDPTRPHVIFDPTAPP